MFFETLLDLHFSRFSRLRKADCFAAQPSYLADWPLVSYGLRRWTTEADYFYEDLGFDVESAELLCFSFLLM